MVELQTFYSGYVRYRIYGRYGGQKEQMENNTQIREDLNIPTVGRKLEYYKYITYLSWKSTMSFAYLSNDGDIDRSLESTNTKIKPYEIKLLLILLSETTYLVKIKTSPLTVYVNLNL